MKALCVAALHFLIFSYPLLNAAGLVILFFKYVICIKTLPLIYMKLLLNLLRILWLLAMIRYNGKL